jgi:hypothetical protein
LAARWVRRWVHWGVHWCEHCNGSWIGWFLLWLLAFEGHYWWRNLTRTRGHPLLVARLWIENVLQFRCLNWMFYLRGWMPYVLMCLSIASYVRSLLLVESLDLRPSNQYILVSEGPSCLLLAKMCECQVRTQSHSTSKKLETNKLLDIAHSDRAQTGSVVQSVSYKMDIAVCVPGCKDAKPWK